MSLKSTLCAATALSLITAGGAFAENLTIATVNNGDMIRMQGLTDDFTAKTGHTVEWVTLEENVLRQRVTTDISTKGGAFDIMTIGMYETPIWGANGWLVSLDDLSAEYDAADILPAMAGGLSHDGTLFAAPFYGESSMVMYRTDLMAAAGLEMPDAPSWSFIAKAARAMTDRDAEINGICLRGKAGWGEGGAFITAMSNSFGARWFDEDWNAQFDTREWSDTLNFYKNMMTDAGPAGYATNGFNENLSLFQQGKCGMWIDATVAASFVTNPKDSTVANKVSFSLAPIMVWASALTGCGRGLWQFLPVLRKKRQPSSLSNGQRALAISSWLQPTKVGPMCLQAHGHRCMKIQITSLCLSHR
jgi:sorbitol/mannitol transport system substrate-binding protein